MKYRVWHRTSYSYDEPVTDSLGVGRLTPRALPWQFVSAHELAVEPVPGDLHQETDYYGNVVSYFQVVRPHTELRVTATTDVEVLTPVYDTDAIAVPWEEAVPSSRRDVPDAWEAVDFALASPEVSDSERARDYAAASLLPGRPLGEAVTDLMHRIHADFEYQLGATTVSSTVDDLFERRAGVCQDFAHLTLSCLRSHGLGARYVSGYLATDPPPGRERVVGADASHAWAAIWVPGGGPWLALDPTNDQWVDDRYVTCAWGRDYSDVPPLKGVIFSEATTSTLKVEVDVSPQP